MNDLRERARLEELLRRAYPERGACPAPETFQREAAGELAGDELRRIEAHAAQCPACRAERELARLFELPREEWEALAPEVEAIVADLEGRRAGVRAPESLPGTAPEASPAPPVPKAIPEPIREPTPEKPRVVGFPSLDTLTGRRARPAWVLAAAAVLVLAIGASIQRARLAPPGLPEPTGAVVMRGSELDALFPLGEIEEAPAELRWRGEEWAGRYRVTVSGVDERVIWRADTAETRIETPAELRGRLAPRVVYLWKVEALDHDGRRIASTRWERFRIEPSGSTEP